MSNKYTFCTVQAIEAEFQEPEGDGKPSVFTKVKVTECVANPSLVGTTVGEYRSLSGGAVKYTMEALRNLGWTCNDITELEGVGSISARGGIHTEEYNGKTSTKCGIWPAKKKRVVSASAKKSFAAAFKKAAAAAGKVDVTDYNKSVDLASLPDEPEVLDDPFALPGDPGVSEQDDPFSGY